MNDERRFLISLTSGAEVDGHWNSRSVPHLVKAEIIVAAGNKLVKHIDATDSADDELVRVRRRRTDTHVRLEFGWHQGGDGRFSQTEKILKQRERRSVHVGWLMACAVRGG